MIAEDFCSSWVKAPLLRVTQRRVQSEHVIEVFVAHSREPKIFRVTQETANWLGKKNRGFGHEPGLLRALSIIGASARNPCTLLDVGSLYGYFSLVAAVVAEGHGFDRAIAVESNPRFANNIESNFQFNASDSMERVLVRAAAHSETRRSVPARVGGFKVELPIESCVARSARGSALNPADLSKEVRLDLVALDDVVSSRADHELVVKIDTEGSQRTILEGCATLLTKAQPTVLVELDRPGAVNRDGASMLETLRLLQVTYGYELLLLNHRDPTAEPRLISASRISVRETEKNQLLIGLPRAL